MENSIFVNGKQVTIFFAVTYPSISTAIVDKVIATLPSNLASSKKYVSVAVLSNPTNGWSSGLITVYGNQIICSRITNPSYVHSNCRGQITYYIN